MLAHSHDVTLLPCAAKEGARANQRQLSRSFRAPSSVDRLGARVFFVVFFVSVAPRQSHSQASQQLFFDSISKRQQPAAKASSRVKRNEEKRDVSSVFSNESVSESECVVDFVTSEKVSDFCGRFPP